MGNSLYINITEISVTPFISSLKLRKKLNVANYVEHSFRFYTHIFGTYLTLCGCVCVCAFLHTCVSMLAVYVAWEEYL